MGQGPPETLRELPAQPEAVPLPLLDTHDTLEETAPVLAGLSRSPAPMSLPGGRLPRGTEPPEPFVRAGGVRALVLPGDLLDGRYHVQRALGDGAMARVFEARNVTLDTSVAIKVLHPEHVGKPEYAARMLREARAVARIAHPNVPRLFDLVQGDPSYLVMEYIDGRPLDEVLGSEGPLAIDEAVALVHDLCAGLEAAHAAGVVHRDVKPANVILVDQLGRNRPVLVDWGLAKLEASNDAHSRQGQIIGTPAYMSPEQIRGEAVDARTDVYGVGCLLYLVLTGRGPFPDGDHSVQIIYKHLYEEPPPPSRLRSDIPIELDEIVLRCLAKSPAERFAGMRELATALRALAPVDSQERTGVSRRLPDALANSTMELTARRRVPLQIAILTAATALVVGLAIGVMLGQLSMR